MFIDDSGDNKALNQGFAEAMQHEGNGLVINASLARSTNPESLPVKFKDKSTSLDINESKPSGGPPLNLPEHKCTDRNANNSLDVSSTSLYRAHRSMRLSVLEASTTLQEEQHRRAREEMRREQAKSNRSAGLIMRHGGELSAEAIEKFIAQQQKEEQKKVQEATKRAGRRHNRKKTSSDIRGMFGNSASGIGSSSSHQRCVTKLPPTCEHAVVGGKLPPLKEHPLPSTGQLETPFASDLPDLPIVRNATKPGQFRKTNYDPFSFALSKEHKSEESLVDSSLHRHLDLSVRYRSRSTRLFK